METLVPGWMPRTGLLLLPLLLCFGPETARSINLDALRDIVNYVDQYGVNEEYAFAVSLSKGYCWNIGFLEDELPKAALQEMQKAIHHVGGLYDPDKGHIVAARMKRLNNGTGLHAEWRLLQGGQNSPVQKLLNRTYKKNEKSCLIFFTLLSPCAEKCLQATGTYSILDMVNDTFCPIDKNAKAFVFRDIYQEDNVTPKRRLEAWLRLYQVPVPLVRCNNKRCKYCFKDNNINSINCLSMG